MAKHRAGCGNQDTGDIDMGASDTAVGRNRERRGSNRCVWWRLAVAGSFGKAYPDADTAMDGLHRWEKK